MVEDGTDLKSEGKKEVLGTYKEMVKEICGVDRNRIILV
jgi:hypothetical protein